MSDETVTVLLTVAVVVLVLQLALALFAIHGHRKSRKEEDIKTSLEPLVDNQHCCGKKKVERPTGGTAVEAWPDVDIERAETIDSVPPRSPPQHRVVDQFPTKLVPSVHRELCEALRGILEEEISRGLQRSGINDRLDRLEKQVNSNDLRGAGMGDEETSKSPVTTAPWLSEPFTSCSRRASQDRPPAPLKPPEPVAATPVVVPALPVPALVSQAAANNRRKEIAPSPLQLSHESSSSKPSPARREIHEESSLKVSLTTVQQALGRRDAETQELKRQLRETSQALWNQTVEARHATKRLQELLSNPTCAPALQAEELARVRAQAEELAASLADAKAQEAHWETIARRQRAFFLQSQHAAQDNFKRHPAGEVFTAPPPICLPEDEDFNRLYDIGTQHLNPYATDSWPFEPNAAAQRINMEQTMPNLEEEEEEDLQESGSDVEDDEAEENRAAMRSSGRTSASPRSTELPREAAMEGPIEPPEPLDGSPPVPKGCPPAHQRPETSRSL